MRLKKIKSRKYALIIDDDVSTVEFIQHAMKYHDFIDFIPAYDGSTGLELYKKYQPGLVITDIVMPNMNGIELINILQNEVISPSIWAITGSCSKSIMADLINLLDDKILLKPFGLEEIDRLVDMSFRTC